MFDEESKITLFDRIKWKVEGVFDFFREIKWAIQRLVRPHHASDCDLWGLYGHLSDVILKKLIAFKKINVNGYPSIFCDWDEKEGDYGGIGITKEAFEAAKLNGTMTGGGEEAWHKVVDEMIFGFEYISLYDDGSEKQRNKFLAKYNLADPHEEIEANKSISYHYRTKDGMFMMSGTPPDKIEEGNTFINEKVFYYNHNILSEHQKRAQAGIDLFAKYFFNLWD